MVEQKAISRSIGVRFDSIFHAGQIVTRGVSNSVVSGARLEVVSRKRRASRSCDEIPTVLIPRMGS